jgi:putative oxidoreductase
MTSEGGFVSTLLDLRRLLLGLCAQLAFAPPLLSRLVIGGVFVHSGWGKLHNLDHVVQFFASLGIPHPELEAPFVACVELVCGALVLVGLVTRLAAVPLIATMVVALATALAPKIEGVSSLFGLAEFLYIVLLVQLTVGGAGALSLDRWAEHVIAPAPLGRRQPGAA